MKALPPRLSKLVLTTPHLYTTKSNKVTKDPLAITPLTYTNYPGFTSILPLALKTIQKIEKIIRNEMDQISGAECRFPIVQTSTEWKKSGRWGTMNEEVFMEFDPLVVALNKHNVAV
jgi:prolyl-tRNA synthetase